MAQNNYLKLKILALLFVTLVANEAIANQYQIGQSNGEQSPVQNCGSQSNCTVNYFNERIGKKLAVRSVYLIPSYKIATKTCDSQSLKCKDLSEVFFIYLELQSIWPEPFLLTAARVKAKTRSSKISMDAGMIGESILATQITKNSIPSQFLFKPGEVKFIGLSQGIKLDGVLEFFKGEILADKIWDDHTPIINPNSERVAELNHFLQKRFGKSAKFRIKLFEKNYQPLITTDVLLGYGSDSFVYGDVSNSNYQFKHDAFIGEVLYQLKGETVPFNNRRSKVDKNKE